jgi:predicted SAM-dependent methyltransferase
MIRSLTTPAAAPSSAAYANRVNLGCGPVQPEGWINVDYSHRARLAHWAPWVDRTLTRLHVLPPTEFSPHTTLVDLRKPLPFADGSIDVFYCGELLEHFCIEQTRNLLRQCVRCLRPGGVFRACVPDNYAFWRRYCQEVEQMMSQPREQWRPQGTEPRLRSFFRDICVERPGLRSMGHFHKWAFDEISLVMELESAGLVRVRRRGPLDSDIPDVARVEVRQQAGFLCVEGRKPD